MAGEESIEQINYHLNVFASGLPGQIQDPLHGVKVIARDVCKTSQKLPTVKMENILSNLRSTLPTEDRKMPPPTLCRQLCHTKFGRLPCLSAKYSFNSTKSRDFTCQNLKCCYFKIKDFFFSPSLHKTEVLSHRMASVSQQRPNHFAILLSKGIQL